MANETLFRALSEYDQLNYDNNDDIKCLLVKSKENSSTNSKANVRKYYDLCIQGKGEYALDIIVGHVQGGKLKKKTSCWISTTSNFDLACSEYAVPQSGNYNQFDKRKNVIAIEVEKKQILSDVDQIKELRDKMILGDIFIDLRNSKLDKYYNECLLSETFNEDMPGYDVIKSLNRESFNEITKVTGFSNFATASEEVLAYKNIKRYLIKDIYYPLQQDIAYGCDTIINLDLNLLDSISRELSLKQRELFDLLYPSVDQGVNLTDVLIQNYNSIVGLNIYEKYLSLKKEKDCLLKTLVEIINSKLPINDLVMKRLIDDGVLVYSTNNGFRTPTLSTSVINDIVLVEHEGNLYQYSHEDKGYVGQKGKILKKDIFSTSTR